MMRHLLMSNLFERKARAIVVFLARTDKREFVPLPQGTQRRMKRRKYSVFTTDIRYKAVYDVPPISRALLFCFSRCCAIPIGNPVLLLMDERTMAS